MGKGPINQMPHDQIVPHSTLAEGELAVVWVLLSPLCIVDNI